MDSVLTTVRSTSDSFRTSASSYSARAKKLAKEHSRLTIGAAAATAVATAGIAAGLSGGSAPGGAAGDVNALNHAGVHTAQVQTTQTHGGAAQASTVKTSADATRTSHVTHTSTAVRGSNHPFTHVRLATADHHGPDANRQLPAGARHAHHRDPFRHFAVIRHHRAPASPAEPYLIYDSTTPSALPSQHVAAAYATGSYAASAAQMAGHKQVVWIDTTGHDTSASALDVEPGDATPGLAANWAYHRLSQHPNSTAVIYTMRSEWPAVQAAVGGLPQHMQDHVRWWIADPTGVPHVVPGAAATQWYWGSSYDITTATPRF
jgi:hypothetical protein